MQFHSTPGRFVGNLEPNLDQLPRDVSIGINCIATPSEEIVIDESSKPLDDATRDLVSRLVAIIDLDFRQQTTAYDVGQPVRHGIRMRTGRHNLLPFVHIDLAGNGVSDKVIDLLDKPGQYVFTSGAGLEQYDGDFWLPDRISRVGCLLFGFGILSLQALHAESNTLPDNSIHKLSSSTVHRAPRRRLYEGKNRLFVGDYVRYTKTQ